MLEHFPFKKLEYALDLYIMSAEKDVCHKERLNPTGSLTRSADQYAEDELMTIKEAAAYIPASRTKVYEMRMAGVLDTIERNSRQKRLLRTQVEAARIWARNKGKW